MLRIDLAASLRGFPLEGITMNSRRSLLAGLLSSWPLLVKVHGPHGNDSASSSPETVEDAFARLVAAFADLDWERFRKCFSENATIFHPAAPNIKRIDSPEQFERAWLGVFDRIKKNSGRTSPPYMRLEPADVRAEPVSNNVTLLTFHLFDGGTTGRRTVVFQKMHESWKVAHIHASNISAYQALWRQIWCSVWAYGCDVAQALFAHEALHVVSENAHVIPPDATCFGLRVTW